MSQLRDISSFSAVEKKVLRPIADTLAMIDGNPFFGIKKGDDDAWSDGYMPQAHYIFEANGGLSGMAGLVCWLQWDCEHPAVREAWENFVTLRDLLSIPK